MTEENVFASRKPKRITDLPEAEQPASNNFKAERQVGMTFNMPESWHKEFMTRSVQENISMRELLIRCFEAYKK